MNTLRFSSLETVAIGTALETLIHAFGDHDQSECYLYAVSALKTLQKQLLLSRTKKVFHELARK